MNRVAKQGRRLTPDARRAQIIEVAERLFGSVPYAELGVPEVAREIGITQGLVYHYFPTKEALLLSTVELRARELLQHSLPDPALPLLEQLLQGFRGYLDYVEQHGLAYRNFLRGPSAHEPEVWRVCEATRAAFIERYLHAMGLAEEPLPATRLSLRAQVSYTEEVVLRWLEVRVPTRAALEQLLVGITISAIRLGLCSEERPSLRVAVAAKMVVEIERQRLSAG